jgi:hypothetical protein
MGQSLFFVWFRDTKIWITHLTRGVHLSALLIFSFSPHQVLPPDHGRRPPWFFLPTTSRPQPPPSAPRNSLAISLASAVGVTRQCPHLASVNRLARRCPCLYARFWARPQLAAPLCPSVAAQCGCPLRPLLPLSFYPCACANSSSLSIHPIWRYQEGCHLPLGSLFFSFYTCLCLFGI